MGSEWRTAPRVCRCCLSEGCYKDISAEYYWMGEKEMYSEMLRECFDLTITLQESSSSSRLICEVCITRLRDAANFKKQVITSEKRFAEHLRTGTSLAAITVNERPPSVQEIKLETVKTEAVISDDDDDDPAEPVDDYDDDPDYDESDSLPLKFEALKKETMVDISFGDEIPVLNNPEMTIKRVSSKTKEKSPSKKIKLSKKELTIKPVKASGSKTKVKAPKEPKVKAPKAAKTSKKGTFITSKEQVKSLAKARAGDRNILEKRARRLLDNADIQSNKAYACKLVESSNACPFQWQCNKFRCFCCDATYSQMAELREHTRSQHSKEELKMKMSLLRNGVAVKIDTTDLICTVCSSPIADLQSLKIHLNEEHEASYWDYKIDPLIPFHLTGSSLKCLVCSQVFQGFHSLNMHMNSHFQHYICETCGAGFSNGQSLSAHKFWHKSTIFECRVCNAIFPSLYKKNLHMSSAHKKKFLHKCPHCDERFKEYYGRTCHMISAHGAARALIKCRSCDKSFARTSSLNAHVRSVHLNERNHSCEVCAHKFFRKADLAKHMVSHGGDSKFECDKCGKCYPRKDGLYQHVKRHCRGGQGKDAQHINTEMH